MLFRCGEYVLLPRRRCRHHILTRFIRFLLVIIESQEISLRSGFAFSFRYQSVTRLRQSPNTSHTSFVCKIVSMSKSTHQRWKWVHVGAQKQIKIPFYKEPSWEKSRYVFPDSQRYRILPLRRWRLI